MLVVFAFFIVSGYSGGLDKFGALGTLILRL